MKRCGRCGQDRPTCDFPKRSASVDGLAATCKACASTYHREWRERNKGRLSASRFEYRQENAERIRDKAKLYYQNNKPKLLAQMKAYHEKRAPQRREYQRTRRLLMDFGITPGEYEAMWVRQLGRCAICGKEEPRRRLAVDHDHSTNKVRGLLCFPCNTFLGRYEAIGGAAAAYLASPPAQNSETTDTTQTR